MAYLCPKCNEVHEIGPRICVDEKLRLRVALQAVIEQDVKSWVRDCMDYLDEDEHTAGSVTEEELADARKLVQAKGNTLDLHSEWYEWLHQRSRQEAERIMEGE